jgi:hypothetical protein
MENNEYLENYDVEEVELGISMKKHQEITNFLIIAIKQPINSQELIKLCISFYYL